LLFFCKLEFRPVIVIKVVLSCDAAKVARDQGFHSGVLVLQLLLCCCQAAELPGDAE
jgi:hypothetical protein